MFRLQVPVAHFDGSLMTFARFLCVPFVSSILLLVSCGDPKSHARLGKTSSASFQADDRFSAFVGEWAESPTGEVGYIFTLAADGQATISQPSNAVWWMDFRDIHFDGSKLSMEIYHFTTNDHPFSGVACPTSFYFDDDTNVLMVHMVTAFSPDISPEPMFRLTSLEATKPVEPTGTSSSP